MRGLVLFLISLLVSDASARDPRHLGRKFVEKIEKHQIRGAHRSQIEVQHQSVKRQGQTLIPQNEKIRKFVVDGTKIPKVPWDVGESYAGLMPISSAPNASKAQQNQQLYFWFFPTSNPNGTDELTIWLNGGPGCSSLEGLLQENGPFLWQYGTFRPVKNPWNWVNLTNMLWVDQPVGTGFSQGISYETNQPEVAKNFLGFLKNFIDTFSLHGKKIYIVGESYAGMYIPYMADAMFNKNDTTYFNLKGTMLLDPSINTDDVMNELPAVDYVKAYQGILGLNKTYMAELSNQEESCGFKEFLDTQLVYPPKGPIPSIPNEENENCKPWAPIIEAATLVNPCFNFYMTSTTCPMLWDVLGFPGSFNYQPEGASIYFNRSDVKKAINAPSSEWKECGDPVLSLIDTSPMTGLSVLPGVIERSERTVIAHGSLDYVLLAKGSLLTIQNMTWNGKQGFQGKPSAEFFVPYHDELNNGTLAGSGVAGITHTERGLTWVELFLSGHMVPQYAPAAAYRQLEFLLGRVKSLEEFTPFTTQAHVPQPIQQNRTISVKEMFSVDNI